MVSLLKFWEFPAKAMEIKTNENNMIFFMVWVLKEGVKLEYFSISSNLLYFQIIIMVLLVLLWVYYVTLSINKVVLLGLLWVF